MNWETILEKVIELGTAWGIRIIGALFALFMAWIVAAWVRRRVLRGLEKRNFDLALSKFFSSVLRYTILVGAVLGVLGVFGVETTSFAAVIGAAGLAIGLAFQGTLSNFAAGVMLLIFRPFKIGHFVSVAGIMGTVQEIDLFTTDLTTVDNRQLVVPNSKIFGEVIENFSHHDTRRVEVAVGVEYDADVDKTREVLEAMVPSIPGVIKDPEPQVFLAELGASSVDWKIRVWVRTEDFWDVHQATVRAAKAALEKAGLSIPFPQVDVHFDEPVVTAIGGKRPGLGRSA
ncbi:MAG: mechanosensitive ion channel [Deltaproteobacteria bacterium]|nr:mechanosensitive ion channel [Deltaproteobacteria bacterium]